MSRQPISGDVLHNQSSGSKRALFKSMGYTDYDLDRPIIGIANAWSSTNPGHFNLNTIAEMVRRGISQGGGTPVEFGVIAPCDGMCSGTEGMKYNLPAREIIADSIENMARLNHFDGLVLLGSCDKIVPAMMMAAARLDIPTILVNGGPMMGGVQFDGRSSDITSIGEALGMLQKGKITEEEFKDMENGVALTCGSCSFMGTANTMSCLAEAIGLSLPGSAMIPAVYGKRFQVAEESGRRIVGMVEEGLNARKIINKNSIENAMRFGLSIGGSTNMALHMPAIAYEADVPYTLEDMGKLAKETPLLARIYPQVPENVFDFYKAGGVMAVMKHLVPVMHTDAMTCTGKTWGEILEKEAPIENDLIHSIPNAWSPLNSLGVLHGNLAPKGAITKPSAIDPSMWHFSGKAQCYNSEEEALAALEAGKITEGTVVVVRYEGPRGGPGMREMVKILKRLYGYGLNKSTAVVTDGRFSGTNNGCFAGHISPEASAGGPLGLVQDGDVITIDVQQGLLQLEVSDEELKKRSDAFVPLKKEVPAGYLRIYSRSVESADTGAIIPNR
ncbi:MAG: dihydroxy-acid dehydratase [Ruminococcaceae bacterium]|nr:dihydroxy-acid dehydratase [Oscillospiraceae bacterium]